MKIKFYYYLHKIYSHIGKCYWIICRNNSDDTVKVSPGGKLYLPKEKKITLFKNTNFDA